MRSSPRRRFVAAALGGGLLLAAATGVAPAGAQEVEASTLSGRVWLGDAPYPGATVVFRRIAAGSHDVVGTTVADAEGSFLVRLPPFGETPGDALIFGTLEHQGVTYYGASLTGPDQVAGEYRIQAFESVIAADPPLPVVRSVFFEAEAEGWRVTDVIRAWNRGPNTLVPAPGKALWRYPLPPAATGVTVSQEGTLPGALAVGDGGFALSSALLPGERIFVARYFLDSLFGAIPLAGPTESLDLFIEASGPPPAVGGLESLGPVALERGLLFHRFWGGPSELEALVLSRADVPGRLPMGWFALATALVLVGASFWARTCAGGGVRPGTEMARTQRGLLLEIARLDEAFGARAEVSEADTRAYHRQRRAMVREVLRVRERRLRGT